MLRTRGDEGVDLLTVANHFVNDTKIRRNTLFLKRFVLLIMFLSFLFFPIIIFIFRRKITLVSLKRKSK